MSKNCIIIALLVFACVFQTAFPQRDSKGGKIIGGTLASEGDFPFIIQMFDKVQDYNFCGGSAIGPLHVLTAAHCVEGQTESGVQIWAGALNIYDTAGYKVGVEKIYQHPDYDSYTINNDVAVIKLAKPFPKSVGLRSVKLASTNVAVGTTCTVCGWGNTGNSYPEDLMYVKIPILSTTKCDSYYPGWIYGDTMVCAHDPNQGTCYGDSGGPLFTGLTTKAVQHGVVSWGSSAGCATKPSVFARVANFYDWIVAKTVHNVDTACADCATDSNWKAMCQSIGGTYRLTATAYQCRGLDITKVRTISYTWNNCNNNKVKDLCQQIGLYSCVNNVAKCTRF